MAAEDVAHQAGRDGTAMTFLIERLAELERYLAHARRIRERVIDVAALETDLTLRNDVIHTLFLIAQLVIDIAGELSSRRGARVENYKQAIHNLTAEPGFSSELVAQLEPLAGFRNVVVHEYVGIDPERVIDALHQLDPIDRFLEIVRSAESNTRP
jgi:uncharacterized protein YutE (UPF0331/DUF86 family)